MTDDFLHEKSTKFPRVKRTVRIHGRLFVLVFAIALLWQGLLLVDKRLSAYHADLYNSFKVILTVENVPDNETLEQMGETLNQKKDITSVKLFSSQDALEVVRRQHPQLVRDMMLGRNPMPAYFELHLTPAAVRNVESLMANIAAEYSGIIPHYQTAHAQLVFTTGIWVKLLRVMMLLAGVLFFSFMFLVEAYPSSRRQTHYIEAAVVGVVAGVCSCLCFCGLLYPLGLLSEPVRAFTSIFRQLLVLSFCGLLGWTLSKWQKF